MADHPPTGEPPRRRRSGASIAAICIGLLILVPSGLCTGFFSIVSFPGMMRPVPQSYDAGTFWLSLIIGAPAILAGIALLVWGLRRDRR